MQKQKIDLSSDLVDEQLECETLANLVLKSKEFLDKTQKFLGGIGFKAFTGTRRLAYELMLKRKKAGKPINAHLLDTDLKKSKVAVKVRGQFVDMVGTGEVVDWTHLKEYLRELKDLATKRERKREAEKYLEAINDGKDPIKAKQELDKGMAKLETIDEKPKVITADELWNTEFEETPYLIGKGLLPKQSVVLLIGHRKRGKTQLSLNIAWCLVTGSPLFYSKRDQTGLFPINEKGVKTLFFFRENVLQTLKKWTSWQRRGLEKILQRGFTKEERQSVILVDPKEIPTVYLDTEKGREAFERIIKANSDVSLVVVDPLSRFISGDLNKSENVTNMMNFLQELGLKHKVAFLLPHHCRKPSGDAKGKEKEPEDPFFEAAGSAALVNCYDSGIAIKRKSQRRSELILEVEFEFRNEESPENITVRRDPETFLFEYLTSEQVATEGASSVSALISIMRKLPDGARYTLIADTASNALGVSKRRITELLDKGQDEKRIRKDPGRTGGYWLENNPKT